MRGSVTQILLRVVFFIVFSWSGDSTKNLIITGMKLVHLSSVSFQVSTFNYHIVVDKKVPRFLQQVRQVWPITRLPWDWLPQTLSSQWGKEEMLVRKQKYLYLRRNWKPRRIFKQCSIGWISVLQASNLNFIVDFSDTEHFVLFAVTNKHNVFQRRKYRSSTLVKLPAVAAVSQWAQLAVQLLI